MKIEQTCKHCGGTGIEQIEIKVGDILYPHDGSAMPPALHELLFTETGRSFRAVKILSIEGDMVAVIPATWTNPEIRHKEQFDPKIYPSLCHIWKGHEYGKSESIYERAFWIHAPTSNFSRRGH